MVPSTNRRQILKTVGAVGTISITGCLGADNGDFPNDNITIYNPFSEGGGTDRTIRQIQPYVEEEWGINLTQEYRPGAGTRLGQEAVLNEEADGYSIGSASVPAFQFTMITGDANYSLDDFVPLGNLVLDPGIIRKHTDDDRFENIQDVIDYAVDNPGELTVSTSGPYNQNTLGLALIEQATGADFTIVPYDGGSDSRGALVQREVDLVHANVYNSTGIVDDTEVLAVHAEENNWEELTDGAPTFSDALDVDQSEIPPEMAEVSYFWYTQAELEEEYPDRLETLQEGFGNAVQSEEYQSDLEDLDPPEHGKVYYADPDEQQERNENIMNAVREYRDLLEETVS